MEIVRYEDSLRDKWNAFTDSSKNGNFLFHRNYMEYHADRFIDFSLLFHDDNKLMAIMPANSLDSLLVSHGGLTFGGIICDYKMTTPRMLEIFKSLNKYLINAGFTKVVYKSIPHIYHTLPAEEDLYALFIHKARLFRRDVSSTILLQEKVSFSKGRKWSIKSCKSLRFDVKRSYDFKTFMMIESYNLHQKYGVKPVHTEEEMRLLADRFPENIKLFAAFKDNVMYGGTIIYESRNVAHTQYIAATDEGKRLGATDAVLDFLINEYYSHKKYFDFGISTEKNGLYLNQGLIQNKESYGARAIICDFYEWDLKQL